jgi:DEAD/DEAH box helicase domain-containing protein
VHSPKCGNGNRPIDKAAALRALSLLLGHETLPEIARSAPAAESPARPAPVLATSARPPRVLFFDLETQRSAEQVGGWHNAALMRVALAVSFDDAAGRFETWRERDVHALLERLAAADLVVGFNVERFDYRVLRGYTDRELGALPTFDLLEAIHARIGFRLPLGHLAEENLGAAKSGDGLQALAWWRQGRLDLIEDYCRRDVALLRDLFEQALARGHLLFRTRDGQRVRIPTPWSLPELLERARARSQEALTGARGRGSGASAPAPRSRAARGRVAARAAAPR